MTADTHPVENPPEIITQDPAVNALVPAATIRQSRIFPVSKTGTTLHVLIGEQTNLADLDSIRNRTGLTVSHKRVGKDTLDELIRRYYAAGRDVGDLENRAKSTIATLVEEDDYNNTDINQNAMVQLVNVILAEAIALDASDIHVHPHENAVHIRFRIDGILHTYRTFGKELLPGFISRIKIMSGLDIAKRRTAQDGRLLYKEDGVEMSFRVSTLPTVVGEKAVLRLLKSSDDLLTLEQLGFSDSNLKQFKHIIEQSYGMVLVTGPTGSGKSFTLFSAMDHRNTPDVNICTVEDPVEYRLPGLAQIQTNNIQGLTFANSLRSLLRQDPDVILVGEIRDQETAQIATEAALTGHLVFATLHTNDAAGAITRLAEMGVERFNTTASLLGILAQRLVRRLCSDCKKPGTPDPVVMQQLRIQPDDPRFPGNYHVPGSCEKCSRTGYRGRTAIHELLLMSDKLEEGIMAGSSTESLRQIGITAGMTTLRGDAIGKAALGITSLEEVIRVTND